MLPPPQNIPFSPEFHLLLRFHSTCVAEVPVHILLTSSFPVSHFLVKKMSLCLIPSLQWKDTKRVFFQVYLFLEEKTSLFLILVFYILLILWTFHKICFDSMPSTSPNSSYQSMGHEPVQVKWHTNLNGRHLSGMTLSTFDGSFLCDTHKYSKKYYFQMRILRVEEVSCD